MKRGYLYVAAGEKYIQEASRSAASLKNIDANANITLISDRKPEDGVFDNITIKSFDSVSYKHGLLYKVEHMYNCSPYDETLFLDSDTFICEEIDSIFEILKHFDVAIAPDPTDVNRPRSSEELQPIKSMDVYNTGVILFKKNERNSELFGQWLKLYQSKLNDNSIKRENDQTSFMESWMQSLARIYVMSHAWNARTPFFLTLNQSVKIIHGRHKDYAKIHEKLNLPHPSKHRCWLPVHEKCMTKKSGLLYHTKTLIHNLKVKLFKVS